MGGEERIKEFPPLIPQEIMLEGIGTLEAVADIKLSSAGNSAFPFQHSLVQGIHSCCALLFLDVT